MQYIPDKWIIIRLECDDKIFYKILSGWSGGYLDGDSWRLSSPIEKIENNEKEYVIYTKTGSIYKCGKSRKGTTRLSRNILNRIQKDNSVKMVCSSKIKEI